MKLLTKAVAHLVGKAAVKLHYKHHLDVYALCSQHEPERYKRTQRKAAIPTGIRWQVWYRDGFTCVYCGDDSTYMTLDHVIPEAHGGAVTVNNLVTACHKCNSKKGSMDFDSFIRTKWLKKRIHRLSSTTKGQKQQVSPQLKEMLSRIASATGRKSSLESTE